MSGVGKKPVVVHSDIVKNNWHHFCEKKNIYIYRRNKDGIPCSMLTSDVQLIIITSNITFSIKIG